MHNAVSALGADSIFIHRKEVDAMLQNRLKSKKGFSLPLAIGITAVLILLSASLIAIAATSIVTTSSSVNQRQAYLNVRSALEYAFAYYSDASFVPDLTTVREEYMKMKDEAGGTVEQGAEITTKTLAEAAKTYVYANYTAAVGTTPANLKITAYSKSSDAFGKRVKLVHLSAVYTINNLSSKNRVTLTDVDMSTDITQYSTASDAISLHVRQYPGQEWTPFYYIWTFRDEAELYKDTDDLFSVDDMYKTQVVKKIYDDQETNTGPNTNTSKTKRIYFDARQWFWGLDGGNYYNYEAGKWVGRYGDSNTDKSDANKSSSNYYNQDGFKYKIGKEQRTSDYGIIPAMNINHNQLSGGNLLEPSGPWNVIKNNSSDPRNGPATFFSPSDDGGGWYNATYYKKPGQVNYFNMILTTKGKVIFNTTTNSFDTEGVQSNEMFHLWYLNPEDKNVYFEFLKPGLVYTLGKSWNGHSQSDDRYIVYVSNKKTAVHLKIKGYGNSGEAAYNPGTAETVAPVITGVTINRKSIFQDTGTYAHYAAAVSGKTASGAFLNRFYRGTDSSSFFYTGEADDTAKFMYEGCGWWVANIPTDGTFRLNFKVTKVGGKEMNYGYTVKSSTNDDAYIVIDFTKGINAVSSWNTEQKAMEYIGEDINSYVTVAVKTSEIGTPVAPYLDYYNSEKVLSKRRDLEKIIHEAEGYSSLDYENYDVLRAALDEGVVLFNKINYVEEQKALGRSVEDIDKDYANAIEKIRNAIDGLMTKECDSNTYRLLEEALSRADKMIDDQNTDYLYEPRLMEAFRGCEPYKAARNAVDKNYILDGSNAKDSNDQPIMLDDGVTPQKYTSTYVRSMVNALDDRISEVTSKALNKTKLKEKLEEVSAYVGNGRYEEEPQNALSKEIAWAEALIGGSSLPEGRQLPTSISSEEGYEGPEYADLDETSTIQQRIDRQYYVLDIYMHKVWGACKIEGLDTSRISDDIEQAKQLVNRVPKVNCTQDTYDNLKNALSEATEVFKKADAKNEDYYSAAYRLEDAIRSFEIVKPGNAPVYEEKTVDGIKGLELSDNSYPNKLRANDPDDLIESFGNMRLWFYGFSKNSSYQGDTYEDYASVQDKNANRKSQFKDEYIVDTFSIEAYKGAKQVGIISSGNVEDVPKGDGVPYGLSFVDVPSDFANGLSFTLDVRKSTYKKNDRGEWELFKTSNVSFEMQENLKLRTGFGYCYVITGDDLKVSVDNPESPTYDTNGQIVRRYDLTVDTKRLSEVYIYAPNEPTVEIVKKEKVDGQERVVSTEEAKVYSDDKDNLYVTRFFYDTDQYIKVSYKATAGKKTYKFTTKVGDDVVDEFKTQVGQTVLSADLMDDQTAHCTFIVPTSSQNVTLEKTLYIKLYMQFGEKVYDYLVYTAPVGEDPAFGEEYKVNGTVVGYKVSVPAISGSSIYTVRKYHGDGGDQEERIDYSDSVFLIPTCVYTFNYRDPMHYGVTTNMDGLGVVVPLRANWLSADTIYRHYAEESDEQREANSEKTTGSSVDYKNDYYHKVIENIPTGYVSEKFDYFAQAGDGKKPVINVGNTVIWINTDVVNKYFKLGEEQYRDIYVYACDIDDNDTNGAWPGGKALRVEDTDNFYAVIPANSYLVILSYKDSSGKQVKIVGKDQPGGSGHVYLDNTDYKTFQTSGSERRWVQYSTCQFGSSQGMCCLYEIIDMDVYNKDERSIVRWYNTKNGITYRDYMSYTHLKKDGSTVKDDAIPDRKYIADHKYDMYYRAKKQDSPVTYLRQERIYTPSGMTRTDLRMAFIGGRKIRITNMSYYDTYTNKLYDEGGVTHTVPTHSGIWNSMRETENNNQKPVQVEIDKYAPYGGSGGNKQSMGRIGDSELTMIYDWYERKIPVDSVDEYLIQVKGLRYNDDYRKKQHKENTKWYDLDYVSDDRYTMQVTGLYGNVWLQVMNTNSTGVQSGDTLKLQRYNELGLYTMNPDEKQVMDDQPVYFAVPDNSWTVNVKARGVAGEETIDFENSGDVVEGKLIYKALVKGNKPFLTFTASNGTTTFTSNASLQGDDNVLYDMSFNFGTGGWDSYVAPATALERSLYRIQQLYYGSVIVKQYNDDGTQKNLGNEGSYEFAEGLNSKFHLDHDAKENGYFFNNGIVNMDYVRSLSITEVKDNYSVTESYVNAYKTLYRTLAQARAYIPKSISGFNYPEYIHNGGKANIYNQATLQSLYNKMIEAKNAYVSSSSDLASIKRLNEELKRAIDDVTVDTENKIAIVYYDVGNYVNTNANFQLIYYTEKDASGNVKESSKKVVEVEERNTEHMPIIFIEPRRISGNKFDSLYNVQFVINGVEFGQIKDKIDLDDSAYVYVDLPVNPYWIQNSVADYRDVTLDYFQKGKHTINYTMSRTKATKDETDLKKVQYRPITLYFRKNVEVKDTDGTVKYRIVAGAYTFEQEDANKSGVPLKAATETATVDGKPVKYYTEAPKVDLYDFENAKKYFEDPYRYYEYTTDDLKPNSDKDKLTEADIANNVTLGSNWSTDNQTVVSNGKTLVTGGRIVAGNHNSTKTVNLTFDQGMFSASRVWDYNTTGKLYFRWASNADLMINNNVTFTANEIRFASAGTINAKNVYNKHVYFRGTNNAKSMKVIFPTDVHVEYYDNYRDLHSFTIREGIYVIEKAKKNQNFIADLCDEEYWSSVHVRINPRYESGGGANSTKTRLGNVTYTDD